MEKKNDLFIPQYDEVFKNVLERYHERISGRRVNTHTSIN